MNPANIKNPQLSSLLRIKMRPDELREELGKTLDSSFTSLRTTVEELFQRLVAEYEQNNKRAKKQISNLKSQVEELNEQLRKHEELKKEYQGSLRQAEALRTELDHVADLLLQKENEIESLKSQNEDLQANLAQVESQMDHITSQLEHISKQYEDLTLERGKEIDALKMLDIYLILLEKVYSANPHTRILVVAHGEKQEWTIKELARATGIEPLAVRRALFELRNAGLFSYDENSGKARLLKRIWQ